MKILNWIDSLLNSREKRLLFLQIVLLVFWMGQWIIQEVLFFKLCLLDSYSSLFLLQAQLKGFADSILIRMLLSLMTSVHIHFAALIQALGKIGGSEYLAVFLSILFLSIKKRRMLFCTGLFLIFASLWILIFFLGQNAQSLNQVITLLKFGGFISLVFQSLIIFITMSLFLKKAVHYLELYRGDLFKKSR